MTLLLCALALGILLTWLTGGRLRNLEFLRLRGGVLVATALVIQLLIFPLGSSGAIITWGTSWFHLASYALLGAFISLNARCWPLALMGLGFLANLIVIVANGGYMPADPQALARAGAKGAAATLLADGVSANTVLMSSATRLDVLGDWMYLPAGVPLATAFSPGDLVIALAVTLFLPYAARAKR